jgi:putative transcriptional regulator
MTPATSLKNQFLLAMPGLTADYFGNSIIYLCEHNDDGAMGIIVNRPTDLSLSDLLQQLGMDVRGQLNGPTLAGGPVQTDRGFILHTDDKTFDSSLQIDAGIVLSTSRDTLESIGNGAGPASYLVALGYAGWGQGQLELELQQNAWLSCPASLDVLFEVPYAERVAKAAAKLGIDFRLMAHQAGHA